MTAPNVYDIGQVVKCYTSPVFKNEGGTAADPTTITFKLKEPDGTLTTYTDADAELVQAGTGDYYVEFTPTQEGKHTYRFEGTGTIVASDENEFDVRASEFY